MHEANTSADTAAAADAATTAAGRPHILIIDDDDRLRALLGRFLDAKGYRVTLACDAAEARQRMAGMAFDMLVVDVMMPGESGLELVRSLKAGSQPGTTGQPPCLMLTAMGEPGERLMGLESGADDYMTKPFEPQELLLRIRNILSRPPPAVTSAPATAHEGAADIWVRFGPHRFDCQRLRLETAGQPRHLTGAEKQLLGCFCSHPDIVLSRQRLADLLGGQMEGRSIDVAVARLRRKLEANPRRPVWLLTARGMGWMLQTDPQPAISIYDPQTVQS